MGNKIDGNIGLDQLLTLWTDGITVPCVKNSHIGFVRTVQVSSTLTPRSTAWRATTRSCPTMQYIPLVLL